MAREPFAIRTVDIVKRLGGVTPLHVMVRRLLETYTACTPLEREDGATWYPNAKLAARRISRRTGISHRRVVRVIAVVSPRQSWKHNLRTAELICYGMPAPGLGEFMRRGVLESAGIKALSGNKTTDFDLAIWGDTNATPIDTWSGTLVLGRSNMRARMLERVGVYERCTQAHRVAASTLGIQPRTLQATTWGHVRGSFT